MKHIIHFVAIILMTFGCSNQSPAEKMAATSTDNLQATSAAISSGKLRFEIRGLNTTTKVEEYGTTFTHKATVVAMGDSPLSAASYLLLYSVKRIEGGDPNYLRQDNRPSAVLIHKGVGDLELAGGYRTKNESWNQEKIEITILGAIPFISIPSFIEQKINK